VYAHPQVAVIEWITPPRISGNLTPFRRVDSQSGRYKRNRFVSAGYDIPLRCIIGCAGETATSTCKPTSAAVAAADDRRSFASWTRRAERSPYSRTALHAVGDVYSRGARRQPNRGRRQVTMRCRLGWPRGNMLARGKWNLRPGPQSGKDRVCARPGAFTGSCEGRRSLINAKPRANPADRRHLYAQWDKGCAAETRASLTGKTSRRSAPSL